MLSLLLILIILLTIIVIQDFKSRSIHWVTLPPLFLGLYFYTFDYITISDLLLNLSFLVIIFTSMVIYLRFRQKEWINPTKEFFGWGDILFLIAITPAANFRSFMFLFIIGAVFSLVLSVSIRIFNKSFDTIPFAGMFSVFMIFYLIYKYFHPEFSFYKLLN